MDDLLILIMGGREDLRIIKLILYTFELMSGLKVNSDKTCLYSSHRNLELHFFFSRMIHSNVGSLPLTYLGITISSGRPRRQDWDILLNKIISRLVTSKSKLLSLDGRLTLVNSVLTAIPTYWMSIFKLQFGSLCIDKIRRDFLWSGPDTHHSKIRLVSWTRLCKSKEQGGWEI